MKKIIALLLISFGLQSQTLLKFKQIEQSGATGSLVITTGTNGVLTYTPQIPYSKISGKPSLAGYVPYTGATTSVNLGSQLLKIYGDSVGFTPTFIMEGGGSINGANPDIMMKGYYNGRVMFQNSITGNTWYIQNNTPSGTSLDNFFIGRTSGTGTSAIRINTLNSVYFADKIRVGSLVTAPSATLDVTGTASISSSGTVTGGVVTPSVTSTGQLNLMCPSGQPVVVKVNNVAQAQFYANEQYFTGKVVVNSVLTPQANLHVTGTASVSSTSTLTGLRNNGTLNVTGASTLTTVNATGEGTFVGVLSTSSVVSTSKTAGIGYAVGSGSTVTQGTSRTTGVTINTINGAITLFSTAGSATYNSFTMTNSAIAATDVVHVTQKSGTDKYIILVSNTAAGSCQITFATTGGTTSEAPVFNFAVIKAVTN